MRAMHAGIIVAIHATIALTACSNDESDTSSQSAAPAATARFANAQDVVDEINRLSVAGPLRCVQLAALAYAETPFQRTWIEFLELVARAEEVHDAADERFGEPIDGEGGDVRIFLSFRDAFLVTEDAERAEAAVGSSDASIKKIMLVKVGANWSISGYTWEYAMDEAKKAELPRRRLTYQVDAEIGPPLAARVRSGEFATIGDLRAAHRESLLTYFERHPDVYEQITGKQFRRP